MSTSPVSVTAVRFTDQFETIPRRIEFNGISYALDDTYKKITLESEEGTTALFDVSDGTHRFRLRQDLFSWRLVSMSSIKA